MDKISTPNSSTSLEKSRRAPRPSKSTLAFLRQFARAYSFEPRLNPSIAALIAN